MNPEQPNPEALLLTLESYVDNHDLLEVSRTLIELKRAAGTAEFRQELYKIPHLAFRAINRFVDYSKNWTDKEWNHTYGLSAVEEFSKFFGEAYCMPLLNPKMSFSEDIVESIYRVKHDFLNTACKALIDDLPPANDNFNKTNKPLRAMFEYVYKYIGEIQDLEFILPVLDRLDSINYILAAAFEAISETLIVNTLAELHGNGDIPLILECIDLTLGKGRTFLKTLKAGDILDSNSIGILLFNGKKLVALKDLIEKRADLDPRTFHNYVNLSVVISNMTFTNFDDTF